MDFTLTDEQKEICSTIKEIAVKSLNNNIFKDDGEMRFPMEKWEICCNSGIIQLAVPEKYEGLGKSILTTALAIKTLSRYCQDEGLVFSICAHLCTCLIPILMYGSEEQKKFYLPKLSSGEFIGGNGTTEANAGSDLSLMSTTVEKSAAEYIINGSKIFVTNGTIADLLIIYAVHKDGIKFANISAFLLEKSNPTFQIGQVWEKMGIRTSPICEILLNECHVKENALLGRERLGLAVFNTSMLWERVIMAAYHIGAMELQFNTVFQYANDRKQFGQKLTQFQNIADQLVKMRLNIETAKLLLYQTCWKFDNDKIDISNASMLKLHTSESKVENSLHAVQIFGAYGYMKEYLVEKQLRDSIASKIYSGTSEIQKKLIIENIGLINE
jgi:alkylation response protein AidB-like acyl-CoA dehydrogenase